MFIRVTEYDVLEVLHPLQGKTLCEIGREIKFHKGITSPFRFIFPGTIYKHLDSLMREELASRRVRLLSHTAQKTRGGHHQYEYFLTSRGLREKATRMRSLICIDNVFLPQPA